MPEIKRSIKNRAAWQRGIKFFVEDLWRLDFSELTHVRKSLYQGLQIFFLVAEGFMKDKLLLRASALTYSTLLAIVPLLAFMFAVLKGMGVQRRLEPMILERAGIGSQEIITKVLTYIDNVNVGSLGALGLIILIVTVIAILGNIEKAFNDIWGIKVQRTFLRKFSDYFSLLLVMPIFLLLALSLTAGLKSAAVVVWMQNQPGLGPLVLFWLRLTPFLALWFFFTFLYMFMPNTRIRLKPALIAGILTGTLWQSIQWAYVTFQLGAAKYNAIYGTFAQVPIMLIWIYISWVIILFGAEFCFALQNVGTYRQERQSEEVNFMARAELALAFLREIHNHFQNGSTPWTDEMLAQKHCVPVRLARRVLEELIQTGLLIKVPGKNIQAYHPARQLTALPVSEVLEKLEQIGPEASLLPARQVRPSPGRCLLREPERALLERATLARRQALEHELLGRE